VSRHGCADFIWDPAGLGGDPPSFLQPHRVKPAMRRLLAANSPPASWRAASGLGPWIGAWRTNGQPRDKHIAAHKYACPVGKARYLWRSHTRSAGSVPVIPTVERRLAGRSTGLGVGGEGEKLLGHARDTAPRFEPITENVVFSGDLLGTRRDPIQPGGGGRLKGRDNSGGGIWAKIPRSRRRSHDDGCRSFERGVKRRALKSARIPATNHGCWSFQGAATATD